MSRVAQAFRTARKGQRAAFIPYITAGDPNLEATIGLVRALVRAGADVIVSRWDVVHARAGIEFVDVTLAMVKPFDPDEETLKLIRDELPKVDPAPLAELAKHEH